MCRMGVRTSCRWWSGACRGMEERSRPGCVSALHASLTWVRTGKRMRGKGTGPRRLPQTREGLVLQKEGYLARETQRPQHSLSPDAFANTYLHGEPSPVNCWNLTQQWTLSGSPARQRRLPRTLQNSRLVRSWGATMTPGWARAGLARRLQGPIWMWLQRVSTSINDAFGPLLSRRRQRQSVGGERQEMKDRGREMVDQTETQRWRRDKEG